MVPESAVGIVLPLDTLLTGSSVTIEPYLAGGSVTKNRKETLTAESFGSTLRGEISADVNKANKSNTVLPKDASGDTIPSNSSTEESDPL